MGVSLKIDPKFKDLINAFSAENLRNYLTSVGDLELSKTRQRFVKQVDPDNNPWQTTVRKIFDPSAKILRRTGALFNSIQRQVSGKSVYVGTNLSYAKTHQEGAVIRPRTANFLAFRVGNNFYRKKEVTIPQRRFIGINSETQKSVEDAFQSTMRKILK